MTLSLCGAAQNAYANAGTVCQEDPPGTLKCVLDAAVDRFDINWNRLTKNLPMR